MDWMNSLVGDGGDCGELNPALDLAQQFINPDLHTFSHHQSSSSTHNDSHPDSQPSSSSQSLPQPTYEMQKILERMKTQNQQRNVQQTAENNTQQSVNLPPESEQSIESNFENMNMNSYERDQTFEDFESSTNTKTVGNDPLLSQLNFERTIHQPSLSDSRKKLLNRANIKKGSGKMDELREECNRLHEKEEMLMGMLVNTLNQSKSAANSPFEHSDFQASTLDTLESDFYNQSTSDSSKIFEELIETQEKREHESEIWEQMARDLEKAQSSESSLFNSKPEVNILETEEKLQSKDYQDYYHFVENNPFLIKAEEMKEMEDKENVMEEDMKDVETIDFLDQGLERMKMGDISGAILFFEAAAYTDPKSKKAWLELGKAQSKNENDRKAIAALKRSLALDNDNLEAWASLAICFANETKIEESFDSLKEWMIRNPKYSQFIQPYLAALSQSDTSASDANYKEDSEYQGPTPLSKRWKPEQSPWNTSKKLDIPTYFKILSDAFIDSEIATFAANGPDPDIQAGLGVLYSANGQYDKAADCWRTAVQIRSDDHTLWNRLGATLANGGNPEEAVEAYKRALSLYPGYSRARYNLAVSCILLGAYDPAIQHLLTILNHQENGARNAMETISEKSNFSQILENSSKLTSQTVWHTLSSALIQTDRDNLIESVRKRDLTTLNETLGFDVSEGGD